MQIKLISGSCLAKQPQALKPTFVSTRLAWSAIGEQRLAVGVIALPQLYACYAGLEMCAGRKACTDFAAGDEWTPVDPIEGLIAVNIGDRRLHDVTCISLTSWADIFGAVTGQNQMYLMHKMRLHHHQYAGSFADQTVSHPC